MEAQDAALAADLYLGPVDLPDIRARTSSVISIPSSIMDGICSVPETVSERPLHDVDPFSLLVDVKPLGPIQENCRTPAMDSGEIFPQYTLATPPKRRSPLKSGHVRGSSSLQEPDMATLLARLELENAALASDPKSGMAAIGAHTGPDSAFEYRVRDTVCSSLSTIVIPEDLLGMTLDEFWLQVTKDYQHALKSMPTMVPLMIHKGVPQDLRSAVWVGITGASDPALQLEFESLVQRLKHEEAPNEAIINKDLARCFPQHDTFKDVNGQGQKMLGLVLKAYSLYDAEIGYCQGMAFVAGILLMSMPPKDAFCVFVKLMETHDLRTMYLPSLSGLHSRTYQLKRLLGSIAPDLLDHLSELGVELAYLSQWFMTLFATTCPLNVLFRLYDVIFAEGADETVMRVALALIATNEERLLAMTELEEVLSLLLSRSLWDPYVEDPDFLMDDVARLCNVVTTLELNKLQEQFLQNDDKTVRALGFTSAIKLFDGWWSAPNGKRKSSISEMPGHKSQRSVSKRSGHESSGTDSLLSSAGTSSTFPTDLDSLAENDTRSIWKTSKTSVNRQSQAWQTQDKSQEKERKDDTHNQQVEGLLLALTEVQREAAQTAAHLQEERAKKESMTEIVHRLRDLVSEKEMQSVSGRRQTMPSRVTVVNQAQTILQELHRKSAMVSNRSVSLNNLTDPASAELQDSLARLCGLLESGTASPSETESPLEIRRTPLCAKPQRPKLSAHRESPSTPDTIMIGDSSFFPEATLFDQRDFTFPEASGHRPRTSSLGIDHSIHDAEIPSEDAILMELVNSKTREATAIHERDEMRAELEMQLKQQQTMETQWAARLQEMERLLEVAREAHTYELAKARTSGNHSRGGSRKVSIAPPVLEFKTERSNSLWPTTPVEPKSAPFVAGGSSSSESSASWWWSKNKQRSVSTENAGSGIQWRVRTFDSA